MYHFIYKTTNTVNGRVYIGKHSTSNLDDGYLGSGKLLKQAIRKYGKHKFKREILLFCNTQEEALIEESKLVTDEFVQRPDTYNLKKGGEGGGCVGRVMSESSRKKLSESRKGIQFSEEHIEKLRVASSNRTLSKKSRKLISKSIIQLSMSGEVIKEWSSTMDVERELSINHASITQCCKGKRKSAGSFKWKYKE